MGRWGCRGHRLRGADGWGSVGGGVKSLSANTACCHKHNRHMNSRKGTGHRAGEEEGAAAGDGELAIGERAKQGGPGFTHSVVICSSCFHTGVSSQTVSTSLSGIRRSCQDGHRVWCG